MLIFRRFPETDRVAFARATPRRGVMPSAGIGAHARHDPAPVRDQSRSLFDIGRSLNPQRVLAAVTFRRIISTIEQRIDRLLPLAVDNSQALSSLQDTGPRPLRRDVMAIDGIGCIRSRGLDRWTGH